MKFLLRGASALAISAIMVTGAGAATLIDGSTTGLYNSGIGAVLNGSAPEFPGPGDPVIDVPASSPPDLSLAALALGDWLTTPTAPGGTWSALPVAIPSTWTVGDETAILYEIDAGATGLTGVEADFGIDNGIFVWLDGTFLGGHLRPGGAVLGEFSLTLGDLGPGKHHLAILREDHGGGTGYSVLVTGEDALPGVPLPASGLVLLTALGGLAGLRRRRRG